MRRAFTFSDPHIHRLQPRVERSTRAHVRHASRHSSNKPTLLPVFVPASVRPQQSAIPKTCNHTRRRRSQLCRRCCPRAPCIKRRRHASVLHAQHGLAKTTLALIARHRPLTPAQQRPSQSLLCPFEQHPIHDALRSYRPRDIFRPAAQSAGQYALLHTQHHTPSHIAHSLRRLRKHHPTTQCSSAHRVAQLENSAPESRFAKLCRLVLKVRTHLSEGYFSVSALALSNPHIYRLQPALDRSTRAHIRHASRHSSDKPTLLTVLAPASVRPQIRDVLHPHNHTRRGRHQVTTLLSVAVPTLECSDHVAPPHTRHRLTKAVLPRCALHDPHMPSVEGLSDLLLRPSGQHPTNNVLRARTPLGVFTPSSHGSRQRCQL